MKKADVSYPGCLPACLAMLLLIAGIDDVAADPWDRAIPGRQPSMLSTLQNAVAADNVAGTEIVIGGDESRPPEIIIQPDARFLRMQRAQGWRGDPMPVSKPDPDIDYKILLSNLDNSIDYKILISPPERPPRPVIRQRAAEDHADE